MPEKLFMVQPDAGLGNRMKCIYSALYFARKNNLKLEILWLRENCCNVKFDEIFEVPENVNIKTIYDLGYKNRYIFHTQYTKHYLKKLKTRIHYYNSEETRDILDIGGQDAIEAKILNEDICIKSSCPICTNENLITAVSELKPTSEITNRVNEIMNPYKDKKVYGIHIRRTDHKDAIANSPLDSFKHIMDELSSKEECSFYLATDDEDVIKEFSSRYDIIPHIRFGKSINRNSSEGIKDAYVDMLCLCRCHTLYGSYESTFSQMVPLLSDTKLVVVSRELG